MGERTGRFVPKPEHQEKADGMKLKKFANPRFLEQIGRGSLALLLARFEPEFIGHGLAVPANALDDETFYRQVAMRAGGCRWWRASG